MLRDAKVYGCINAHVRIDTNVTQLTSFLPRFIYMWSVYMYLQNYEIPYEKHHFVKIEPVTAQDQEF